MLQLQHRTWCPMSLLDEQWHGVAWPGPAVWVGVSAPSHFWHGIWGVGSGWVWPLGLALWPSRRICDTLNNLLMNPFLFSQNCFLLLGTRGPGSMAPKT